MKEQKYFSELNYTLGNEDTSLEVSIVEKLRPHHIFSVAGCGSRALPLLSCSPASLTCIDVCLPQLYLCELRYQAIRQLELDEFLTLFGVDCRTGKNKKKIELFNKLILSSECFDQFKDFFYNTDQSLIYQGKWEKTFTIFSKIVNTVMGDKGRDIFHCTDLSQQRDYYNHIFPILRWKFLIAILGNKAIFNALLYRGDFIKKNVSQSHFQYYFQSFEKLFHNVLARESFFLNLLFFGEIKFQEARTIEMDAEIYSRCKQNFDKTEVRFLKENMLQLSGQVKDRQYDFLSLSDVPSYFSGNDEKLFLQNFRPVLSKGALIVLRSYLRIPQADLEGFQEVTSDFQDEIDKECLQMYRIQIFKYLG